MKDYSDIARKNDNRFMPIKLVLLAALIFLLLAGAVAIYVVLKANSPYTGFERVQQFEVRSGESGASIANRLEQEGLISSEWIFRLYATLTGKDAKLQAGVYELDSSMSISQIASALAVGLGGAEEIAVTFYEGWTAGRYASALAEDFPGQYMRFLSMARSYPDKTEYPFLSDNPSDSLEGYLFPDTYRFRSDAQAEQFIAVLLSEFDEKFDPSLRTQAAKLGMTVHEAVTLASIIEGEVGRSSTNRTDEDNRKLDEERKMVAGVFYNRLQLGMPLQSDATLNYVIGEGRRQATTQDTQIDSPYNTYKHIGLPPGPIGNPSLSSLRAAVFPASHDYLYFLSKADGEAVFSKTLDEHNVNKAKYLP